MAKKKAAGSVKNGRDSESKRLGIKKGNNSLVKPGDIIVRQKGNLFKSGINTKEGKDRTIFSLIKGRVFFKRRKINVITLI
ncbi:LSU ribosomal protein L27p [Candidatus Vidania fulgoroideae]|nr:LSU ribosomal protein L27p [Candidatus Vidania fulgoroideae]